MIKRFFVLLCLTAPLLAGAQLPKGTDIWLFEYKYQPVNRGYVIGAGEKITNNPGYDNQPAFSPGGDYILYSSDTGNGQTDIYRYDIRKKTTQLWFNQPKTSEYSPTFVPGNKFISTVTVEQDSSQRIWMYNKATKERQVVLPKKFGVGYHTWFDERTLFMFLLTEPFTLVMGDPKTGQVKTVADSIGRSMAPYRLPTHPVVLFTQQKSDSNYVIKAVNPAGVIDNRFTPIDCVKGSQDFAVDKMGNIFMAKGSKLYVWYVDKSSEWREVMDLSFAGVKNITRIAFDKNGTRLAVVENKPE